MNPEQLAQEHQLGLPIDSFSWHRAWAKAWIVIALFMLPFALLFSFLIVGLPILIYCIFSIYSSICQLRSGKVVYFYEHGLIDLRKRRPVVIRYQDIRSLKSLISKQYLQGVVYLWTNTIHTVELNDGRKVIFNHSLQNIEHLGTLLGDKLVECKLPTAIADLQQGHSLQFGKLTVTSTGLQFKQKFLPWPSVSVIQIVPCEYVPTLSIFSTECDRQGNLKCWKNLGLDSVPNIPLLLVLADWLRHSEVQPTMPYQEV